MKIIKQGKIEAEKEITVTCKKCETKFSYTREDVKPDQRDGDYVECPICKSFIASKL